MPFLLGSPRKGTLLSHNTDSATKGTRPEAPPLPSRRGHTPAPPRSSGAGEGSFGCRYGGFQTGPRPTPCRSPLPELLEEDAVGKALATDADALQDAVTAQLVQHQPGVQLPCLRRAVTDARGQRPPHGGATHRPAAGRGTRVGRSKTVGNFIWFNL